MQASPLNLTNVAASTLQLALSLSRAHTPHIYLYAPTRLLVANMAVELLTHILFQAIVRVEPTHAVCY